MPPSEFIIEGNYGRARVLHAICYRFLQGADRCPDDLVLRQPGRPLRQRTSTEDLVEQLGQRLAVGPEPGEVAAPEPGILVQPGGIERGDQPLPVALRLHDLEP